MKRLLLTILLISPFIMLNAQETVKPQMNFIKFNLTSIALKNYSLQYERVLSKRLSASVSFRIMPYTTMPYKNNIIKTAEIIEQDQINMINNVQIANYAITPELRLYLGKKGYGRGFYIAPYYRYAAYDVKNLNLGFDFDDNNEHIDIDIKGSISSHTGGLMFGAQWAIGKYLTIDWWILGAAYGVSKGVVSGVPSKSIPNEIIGELRDELNDYEIPMVKKSVTVTQNLLKMELTGPWAGIRSGVVFGIKF